MKRTLFLATLACALLSGCAATKPSPIDELSLQEGLQRVDSKVADAVYRRPEARMSVYSKVLLRPIEVQFAKDWDPSKDGSALYRMHLDLACLNEVQWFADGPAVVRSLNDTAHLSA